MPQATTAATAATTSTPFLRQVARYYVKHFDANKLKDLCFVFPNRRAGQFFERELQDELQATALMPQVIAIDALVANFTDLVTPTAIERLFALYLAYRREMVNDQGECIASSFEDFVKWGNILLIDFENVDMNHVDADQLFQNLDSYRDINANYITDESVREAIERILGIMLSKTDNDTPLWQSDEMMSRFVTLWNKLAAIYHAYHAILKEHGAMSRGMMYRNALEKMTDLRPDQFPCSHLVMVGFSGLTKVEEKIFNVLKDKRGLAHFWWDDVAPAFDNDDNAGGRLVRNYHTEFPHPYDATLEPATWPEQIRLVKVPSGVGMAKWAFHDLGQQAQRGEIDGKNAINTAVLLPDENMLIPVVNSIDPAIERINVTLGYPLRQSQVVTLMHLVAIAHSHARMVSTDGTTSSPATLGTDDTDRPTGLSAIIGGTSELRFLRDDVKNILSHPLVKTLFAREILLINATIDRERLFYIPVDMFRDTPLINLFTTIQERDLDSTLAYIDHLIDFVRALDQMTRPASDSDDDDSDDIDNGDADDATQQTLQGLFYAQYIDVMQQLRATIEEYATADPEALGMTDSTVFFLIDRLVGAHIASFNGEPLRGLQVMGMLESRCLDFENVVILSANERILPRRRPIPTMVPELFRRAFGMTTNDRQEDITTYNFYRLITRCRRLTLVCDTGSQGRSSEPTRYAQQLATVYQRPVETLVVSTQQSSPSNPVEIELPKDVSRIAPFLPDASEKKYLSASVLRDFVACPLTYALSRLYALPRDRARDDFMDAATFGTIVHNTLQALYSPEASGKPRTITVNDIQDFKKSEMERKAIEEINREYVHTNDITAPLDGEARLMLRPVKNYVSKVLDYDINLLNEKGGATLVILECETDHKIDGFTLLDNGNGQPFNFTFKCDRVDCILASGEAPVIRIIDYKTGGDVTRVPIIADICPPREKVDGVDRLTPPEKPQGALLQLLLYSRALQHVLNHEADLAASWEKVLRYDPCTLVITPIIYKIKKMDESYIKVNGDQFELHPDWNAPQNATAREFLVNLNDWMTGFFNPDLPFSQAPLTSEACRYCLYVDLCRRMA